MKNLSHLPEPKRLLLEDLVDDLKKIPGVAAVVLGGSYASGTYRPESDLDVGLYYHESRPFVIADIAGLARSISSDGHPTVTDFYGWGPWVNGGAWINTRAGKMDFLYRNIEQVELTIREARKGIHRHDYSQQPVTGFYSVIYLAETQVCIPLHDPDGLLTRLKRAVRKYPSKLKKTIVGDSLWSAEFTFLHARGFAARGDVVNMAGCLTRSAANLNQAIFALNEAYFFSDKAAVKTMPAFSILPPKYAERVAGVLARVGATPAELTRSVTDLESVWKDIVSLAGELYRPRFLL